MAATMNASAGTVGQPSSSESESPDSSISPAASLPYAYVSQDFLQIFVFVDYVFVSVIVCAAGIVFNIINIVVFYRLGFGDTVNISLFSLALADLGALLPLLWKCVLFNPSFHNAGFVTFDYVSFQYYTAGWVHGWFANIGCLIMFFVTLDRCLCIAMPLKVRSIITPKRTTSIILSFFLVFGLSRIPLYATLKYGPVFFEKRNRTLIAFLQSEPHATIRDTIYFVHVFNQVFCACAVTIFSTILVIYLRRQSKWRKKAATNSTNSAPTNDRDVKTMKLILFIAIFFLIVNIPKSVIISSMVFDADFNFSGRYRNLCTLVWAIINLFCASNSTVNIFVYVNMSSKYAGMFYTIFKCFKRGEKVIDTTTKQKAVES